MQELRSGPFRAFKQDGNGYIRLEHPGAVVVIPFLSDPYRKNPTVLFIEQDRMVGPLIEFPAGTLDKPGEPEATCAIRELEEEAGYTAKRICRLTSIYPSPGISTEVITIFAAKDLEKIGEPEPGITIRTGLIKSLLSDLDQGKSVDSKTLTAILYWKWARKSLVYEPVV